MVHLTSIPTDSSLLPSPPVEGSGRPAALELPNEPSPLQILEAKLARLEVDVKDRTATGGDGMYMAGVYGSRFASQDLPKYEMAEGEMPKEVAYRMIKDETSLDGNPMLK